MIACAVTDPGIVPACSWIGHFASKYDRPKEKEDDFKVKYWLLN